jgi:hypothetical protein
METFFSMSFFSIDPDNSGVLPSSNIRYIWIFVIVACVMSSFTWTFWYLRRQALNKLAKDHNADEMVQNNDGNPLSGQENVQQTVARLLEQADQLAPQNGDSVLEEAETNNGNCESAARQRRKRFTDSAALLAQAISKNPDRT